MLFARSSSIFVRGVVLKQQLQPGFSRALLSVAAHKQKEKDKKGKGQWSKQCGKMRYRCSYENLLRVLRKTAPEDYKNFLRMNDDSYDMLLKLIRPEFEEKHAFMH